MPLIKAIRWQSTCFWKAGRRGTEDSSCSQAVRSQPWTVKSPKSSPANPPTTRQRTVSKSGPCGSGSVLGDTLGSVSCEIFRLHRGEALAEPWGLREEGPRTVKDKRAKRVIEEDRQAEVLCHSGPTPLPPDGAFGQDVTWKGATTVLSLHAPTPTPAPRGGGGGGGGGGEQSSMHLAHSGPSAEEAGCSEVGPGCWGAVPSLFPSPGSQPGAPRAALRWIREADLGQHGAQRPESELTLPGSFPSLSRMRSLRQWFLKNKRAFLFPFPNMF